MTEKSTFQVRRPFTGSCHCGATRYIVYLNIPHQRPTRQLPVQVSYRCNCKICQKSGMLHLKVESSPDDFILLSPLDPLTELENYLCDTKQIHWPFCKHAACVTEVELPGTNAEGEKTRFWHVVKEGWKEGSKLTTGCCLAVNALTIDAGQEGIDLAEWTEKNFTVYVNNIEADGKPKGGRSVERPFPGGCY
ncbi:hypothetical protein GQ53DRAFT_861020 [Thozetella sp. PMI_491]|nr:hypothetical protein GQ53DRAFT_861020 [Thozetella sp. PMI_491]